MPAEALLTVAVEGVACPAQALDRGLRGAGKTHQVRAHRGEHRLFRMPSAEPVRDTRVGVLPGNYSKIRTGGPASCMYQVQVELYARIIKLVSRVWYYI